MLTPPSRSGNLRVGMSQKNRRARIKLLLVASCAMGARTRSGVRPARLLSPLSLLQLYRCTTSVRPRSPVARYTVAFPQAHVDFVRSISTGLRLDNVLTFIQLRHQCSRNCSAPDCLSHDGGFPRTSIISAPGGMQDNGNRIKSMSERGIISSPTVWGNAGSAGCDS
jgi:hypothetical protein